jgi:hypothetical protein
LQTKKTAPFGVTKNMQQDLRPIISINKAITICRSVHVRGPGETGGAFGFALIFLLLFASRQKVDKVIS